jgi:hypothetical protein
MSNSLKNKSFLTGKQKAIDAILISLDGLFTYLYKTFNSRRSSSVLLPKLGNTVYGIVGVSDTKETSLYNPWPFVLGLRRV